MPPRPSTFTHIELTLDERATLLANVDAPNVVDEILRAGRVLGPVVHLDLDDKQLETFLVHLEQVANIALNVVAASTLSHVLSRIQAGLTGTVDPGWHVLRPAIARLGFTAKQGQYSCSFTSTLASTGARPPNRTFKPTFARPRPSCTKR